MSLGKMNTLIDIIKSTSIKDDEGFTKKSDEVIASVRAYKEERHGSRKWANMAAYSKANAIFQFRKIPGVEILPGQIITCDTGRYTVISVEHISNFYIEVAAEKIEAIKGQVGDMARASFKMPEEFLLKVSSLAEKTDEIIPKVLEAGAEVAKAKVKSLLNEFGWKNENILDLGDITNARGSESVLPIWLRVWGATQNGAFNFKIVSQFLC